MKYEQTFHVGQPVSKVWDFFEQFEKVAQCIPGVQKIDVQDADHVIVTIAQRLGPLSATFESRIQITQRVEGESLAFTSVGKAIKGAIGHFRGTSLVRLSPQGQGTAVHVSSDLALGGALGSVGQKVVATQAAKVADAFAASLENALSGRASDAARPVAWATESPASSSVPVQAAVPPTSRSADFWPKMATAVGMAVLALQCAILWRLN